MAEKKNLISNQNNLSSLTTNNFKSIVSIIQANQNLDRLNKLSEKLNSIHVIKFKDQTNIESDKYSKFEDLEVQLAKTDNKNNDYNVTIFKQISNLKEQISKIIKEIEEEKQTFETKFESQTQFIRLLELKIMERFDEEGNERKEVERKLLSFIEEKYTILRNELTRETKNRNESLENFSFYLEVIIVLKVD